MFPFLKSLNFSDDDPAIGFIFNNETATSFGNSMVRNRNSMLGSRFKARIVPMLNRNVEVFANLFNAKTKVCGEDYVLFAGSCLEVGKIIADFENFQSPLDDWLQFCYQQVAPPNNHPFIEIVFF